MSTVTALTEQPLRLQAGGTLVPRRHLYLERAQDEELLELLLGGQYVNLLTSRQMGKSSLVVRAAQALASRGVRTASIDLAAELGTPADAGSYFLGLLTGIACDLPVNIDLETWWRERGSETVNQRLMRFFRDVVAEQIEAAVVIFLDEIDSTLKFTYTDDLFTAIRGMHNERSTVTAFERTTFCLIGVATPNELIKDRRTTPYNVGRTLELRDFDPRRDNLVALERAMSSDPELGGAMLERVLHWTGGHPYLTLRLCTSLQEIEAATPNDVDRRVEDSFRSLERVSNDSHFDQVLRFLETRLSDGLATFNLYEKILKDARERDRPTVAHTELKLSGLVKRDEAGWLVVRNRIYERLFDRHWVESAKPRRELRTYRRYTIAAGVVLLVGALVAGGWITYLQRQLNERERLEALSVSISESRTGTRITFPAEASQVLLEETAQLLKAIGPVTQLDLSKTKVIDVAPLAGVLTNLQWLDLSGTQVADITPLAKLTNLQLLDLSGTQVADIAPLAKLTNLQRLDLSDTQVADAAPLANLTDLRSLHLSRTQVADATPLANLTNLRRLILSETQVGDAAPLANLINLQGLGLSDTQVADLAPLANLISLQLLDLLGTPVTGEEIASLRQALVDEFTRQKLRPGSAGLKELSLRIIGP